MIIFWEIKPIICTFSTLTHWSKNNHYVLKVQFLEYTYNVWIFMPKIQHIWLIGQKSRYLTVCTSNQLMHIYHNSNYSVCDGGSYSKDPNKRTLMIFIQKSLAKVPSFLGRRLSKKCNWNKKNPLELQMESAKGGKGWAKTAIFVLILQLR